MRNDVNPPPLEPEYDHPPQRKPAASSADHGQPVMRSVPPARSPAGGNGANGGRHLSDRHDRPHDLDRGTHGEGHNLVFSEPEDRGDSFNTIMSAVIAGVVLICVLFTASYFIFHWR